MTDKNRRKKENSGQEELEVGAVSASAKYSNISPVYHIFNKKLNPHHI
jgi:hypothetical protein